MQKSFAVDLNIKTVWNDNGKAGLCISLLLVMMTVEMLETFPFSNLLIDALWPQLYSNMQLLESVANIPSIFCGF